MVAAPPAPKILSASRRDASLTRSSWRPSPWSCCGVVSHDTTIPLPRARPAPAESRLSSRPEPAPDRRGSCIMAAVRRSRGASILLTTVVATCPWRPTRRGPRSCRSRLTSSPRRPPPRRRRARGRWAPRPRTSAAMPLAAARSGRAASVAVAVAARLPRAGVRRGGGRRPGLRLLGRRVTALDLATGHGLDLRGPGGRCAGVRGREAGVRRGQRGRACALERAATGAVIWTATDGAFGSSPLIAGDLVVVRAGVDGLRPGDGRPALARGHEQRRRTGIRPPRAMASSNTAAARLPLPTRRRLIWSRNSGCSGRRPRWCCIATRSTRASRRLPLAAGDGQNVAGPELDIVASAARPGGRGTLRGRSGAGHAAVDQQARRLGHQRHARCDPGGGAVRLPEPASRERSRPAR